MNATEQHIYSRQIALSEVGTEGQQKLLNTRVVIVGAGGLGCPAALYLVAAGIGHITLIDGDLIETSNLHRQVLFGMQDVGTSKATVAASKLSALHPHLTIQGIPAFLDAQNALELLGEADIVVDCTDNFTARYLINDACVQLNLPFVSGAIYKFEGQLALLNHQNGPTYRCVFPEFPNEKNHPNCEATGVLGVLPGIIGTMQATEVLKWALGMEPLLDREMLLYDARTLETRKVKLPSRNESLSEQLMKQPLRSHVQTCETPSIEWEDFETQDFGQIIDIREPHETPKGPGRTTHQLPWSEFEHNLHVLKPELRTAVYCQSGTRSQKAVQLLQNVGFDAVSVNGGIHALIKTEHTL